MRWTWRYYATLAVLLAASVAFMDVIGSVPKFDAATWWRVLFSLWLGQLAGYVPAFAAACASCFSLRAAFRVCQDLLSVFGFGCSLLCDPASA